MTAPAPAYQGYTAYGYLEPAPTTSTSTSRRRSAAYPGSTWA